MRMMITGAAIAALAATVVGAAEQASPYGNWRTPDKGGLIEVSQCDGGLCGKILSGTPGASPEGRLDSNNKNPALRGRALVGLYIFRGLKPADGSWKGSMYNPNDGGTYAATISLKSAGSLEVKGCIVWPMCKTQVWTRAR